MRVQFDERDAEILAKRSASLMENPINVGDFVTFADGVTRRVSYIWPDFDDTKKPGSIQTSCGGSFYLGDGYVSYSGSLYSGVPFDSLVDTGDLHDGIVWFFHHDYAMRDCGVHCSVKFKIWHCSRSSERC